MIADQLTFDATDTLPLPAHIAVAQGRCSWCGKACDVVREPEPHITVPSCGCRTHNIKETDREKD
jgi:hypothetical protein